MSAASKKKPELLWDGCPLPGDRLPQVLPVQATLVAALALRLPTRLRLGEAVLQFELIDTETDVDDMWCGSCVLASGGIEIPVTFTQRLLACLDPGLITPSRFARWSEQLRTGALLAALDPALDAFERASGSAVALRDVTYSRHPVPRGDLTLGLRNASGEACGALSVMVDATNGPLLQRLVERLPTVVREHLPDIALPVGFSLGSLSIGGAAFASLRCGDVLRPGVQRHHNRFDVFVGGRPVATAAIRKAPGLELEVMEMAGKTESPESAEDRDEPVALKDVEVQLRFDVGHTNLSLEALRSLQPGYVFRLPGSGVERIRIRANGALVGQGELVAIGDELGVRLLELADGSRRDDH